jgi:hypothetical protein
MAFTITATSNVDAWAKKLDSIGKKQIPFATASAMTAVAKTLEGVERAQIARDFKNPTPFTLKLPRAITANKNDFPNLKAGVRLTFMRGGKDVAKILTHEVTGGSRFARDFEDSLRAAGILKAGEFVVPAEGFPLDQFGNFPSALYKRILKALLAGKQRKATQYFTPAEGGALPRGIYEKLSLFGGRAIRGVLMFVRQPTYSKRLEFHQAAADQVSKTFPAEFNKAMTKALATAR